MVIETKNQLDIQSAKMQVQSFQDPLQLLQTQQQGIPSWIST